MRVYIFLLFLVIPLCLKAQNRRVVAEFLTGTWCMDCPCGERMMDSISSENPDVIFLSYHYFYGSDPFAFKKLDSLTRELGYSWLPSSIIDRSGTPVLPEKWNENISGRAELPPSVAINFTGSYNTASNEMNLSVSTVPLNNLEGIYKLQVIILEDSLIYEQTGNTECPGAVDFVHSNVVRSIITSWRGDTLNYSSTWQIPDTITKNYNVLINQEWNLNRLSIAAFVFKSDTSYNLSEIQQGLEEKLLDAVVLNAPGEQEILPSSFILYQNYPNPFNPATTISYHIPKEGLVVLKIYDVLGNEIAALVNEYKPAGSYTIDFDGGNLSSGIYFSIINVNGLSQSKKLILMK